ncbi:uncharacterized protein N7477_001198 [Penicillium maclennaniae]|uniref:uncharacterized protein n=1 Tax=Penicillium maclennaniae TaxID=1343394 RepID=UPI0025420405|nr:uncharacterized protein N7477_001198 [Penicillium maclennaniae]KAJ5684853.1 hypothetical protein N7477_001198 [Penicillium maclennaniae]
MGGQSLPEKLQQLQQLQGKQCRASECDTLNNAGSCSLSSISQQVTSDQQQTSHASEDPKPSPRPGDSWHNRSKPRRAVHNPDQPPSDATGDREDAPNTSAQTARLDENKPRRRFLPQPIETTTKSSNAGNSSKLQTSEQKCSAGPRRFKPDLIETDRRSVKGESEELPHASKSPGLKQEAWRNSTRLSPNRPVYTELPESKFSYASLLRRQEGRRHSFRVPELPSIESSGSEDSDEQSHSPSLSSSYKSRSSQKFTGNLKPEKLRSDSCDAEYSEYLLSLAARSAQKQLREQALAASPNEQAYEPVDHFDFAVDDEDSQSEDDLKYPQKHHLKSRRQSSADLSWELEYMRHHKEEAEMRLRAMVNSRNRNRTSAGYQPTPRADGKISPPMLGEDIVLPQSASPDGTMCENSTTENGSSQDPCHDCGGLWCADSRPDGERVAGLWMGTCRKGQSGDDHSQPFSGIMTPRPTDLDRLSRSSTCTNLHGMAGSSPRPDLLAVTSKSLEDEFHDGFVTQIYNYLSLGYPCIARYYDYELSKISGFTVQDLRRDDLHTDARGYVVAMESDANTACTRWRALRRYIREWARQQPSLREEDTGLEAWGMPERRGSWAI